MSCRLFQDIKHSCEYNHGGMSTIKLLDINDFAGYKFEDDLNFDESRVELIYSTGDYIVLDSVNESNFAESYSKGIYTQQLTTFVRTINHQKTASLLLAGNSKYVVVFYSNNRIYTFGSDGGASVSFNQQTGQMGEVMGYNITISKDSIYPLFEAFGTAIIDKKIESEFLPDFENGAFCETKL